MYNHQEIEKKWRLYWEENKTFKTDLYDFTKPKYYVLGMFPYPSGVGLHAGHPEGYTATDIMARLKRMQGYNVLNPMGFDSFGLPAEQYAIETGNNPNDFTIKNINTFREQLKLLGFSYDWDLEISTSDPNYYKWTQWIFKKLYENGLAKYTNMPVNWCPALGTVLSNDEVINGKSERGGHPVIRKNMPQWVIDIPKYADKLLEGLEDIDWPNSTKEMQKNWIGKSVGATVMFKVSNTNLSFSVFTTRPDTLFGATYCVMAPEHKLVKEITSPSQLEEVLQYQEKCSKKSEMERTELSKDKTGVFLGAYAINPVNNKEIPIYISDYVLESYGSGAIMAVPAHDERDYDFAKKYNLEIIPVIEGNNENGAYTEDGKHINSEFLNGLNKEEAINKILIWLEENKLGEKTTSYHIRDWIFARQRYWGEPIPVIHKKDGTTSLVEDRDLPLVLPVLKDYAPASDGSSPLSRAKDWLEAEDGVRESSTMPGSAGSSWYFLRYIDPHNSEEFANYELLKHWLPVDLYIGGPEHTTGHLLYSRMWNRFLYDINLVPYKEPFKKLVHQGMILGSNGIKMGKRYPEFSINPNDIVAKYGADTLRLYEMFMGPLEVDKPWNDNACEGARRFIERVYRISQDKMFSDSNELEKIYHQTVKKVTNDYETLNFNTAISAMMIFVNAIYKSGSVNISYYEGLIKLLNPIAPFVTEEIWHNLGHENTISYEKFPTYDEKLCVMDTYEMVVQVNGKVRGKLEVATDTKKEDMEKYALEIDNVKKFIEGKEIIKIIIIPGKIVNIVVKE